MRFALFSLLFLEGAAAFSASQQSDRRDFLAQVASVTAAATLGAGTSTTLLGPVEPANAVGGLNKVNAKLKGYGLPTVGKVPDGFTPILEIYGKGKNRFPILVGFNHPLSWVITLPSNDINGEDGTVQVGDYGKGDTATFFVYEEKGHVDPPLDKETINTVLAKCISQKGDNMYENFKVTKTDSFTTPDGQTYVLADFKYSLLTGAGFIVDRKGVASVTSQGAAVEALWAASTAIRYKKTEPTLRDIVASFRCYTDGIKVDTVEEDDY